MIKKNLIRTGKIFLRSLIFLPLFFIYSSKIEDVSSKTENSELLTKPEYTCYETQWVDSVFETLTPDERLGQLFMIAAHPERGIENKNYVKDLIEKYKVGGICMFQGGPVQQAKIVNYYQSISDVPLMIAGDYEWGLSMRLDSAVRFPRQMMLGAIQDEKLLYDMGEDFALQFKKIGTHINFAPVIDVNNNPNNPVINDRSFGEQAVNVARKGTAYMFGMQDKNILATGKHFPGHGDTDVDSHYGLPVIKHTKERLDSIEFYPFKQLINTGLGGVMIAHLHIPSLDSTKNLPSSLSKPIVTDILKNKMGFKGIIFTDALGMHGVSKYFDPGVVDVKALIAGTDVLLMSKDVPKAFEEIKKAIKNGDISQKEIDERCKKILMAKKWFGLDKYKPSKTKGLYKYLNRTETVLLRRKLIESALTLAVNKDNIIPFKKLDSTSIASLSIGNGAISNFQVRLKSYTDVKNYSINKSAELKVFNKMVSTLSKFDAVVVAIHNTNRKPPHFGVNEQTINFIEKLSKKTKVVLSLFANPYALGKFKNPENLQAVLVSYNDWATTRDLSAQLLFGGIEAKGKLPVSAGEYFKAGQGSVREKVRLKYSLPDEIKIRKTKLKVIDSVILGAISEGATPGATVMAIKDGVVFYQKSFGTHTYLKQRKNKNSDIYDLASLTKISATMPSLMKLYEQKRFDFNKTLSAYISGLDTSNMKDIVLKDILAHQGRLKPWIPFYLRTFKDKDVNLLDEKIYSKKKSKKFPNKVAENLYISKTYEDSIFHRIYYSKLRKKKKYKYSDLGFYMFYRIIENITKTPLEEYTHENFYSPLGAVTTGYKPTDRFNQTDIVPTEEDVDFRRQLLQGYVHDYGAAMTDQVNGHAGLFSNANDIAKLLQMYLQKGTYGGKRYFRPETIELFTECAFPDNDNRRALGFDKVLRPEGGPSSQYASDSSFGHSGFTGILAWVDPEYQFVYLFLSNRIHPTIKNNKLLKMNTRTVVQDLFYESFLPEDQIVDTLNLQFEQ